QIAFGEHGDGGDARMRMEIAGAGDRRRRIDQVEEDERLEILAEVRRAHQPGDRGAAASLRAMNDLTRGGNGGG
ncbi:hypothetical protein QU40_00290, partial [Staphylococcus aureus]